MSTLRQRRTRRARTSFLPDFIKRECVISGTRHTPRIQDSHKAGRLKSLLRSDSKSRNINGSYQIWHTGGTPTGCSHVSSDRRVIDPRSGVVFVPAQTLWNPIMNHGGSGFR